MGANHERASYHPETVRHHFTKISFTPLQYPLFRPECQIWYESLNNISLHIGIIGKFDRSRSVRGGRKKPHIVIDPTKSWIFYVAKKAPFSKPVKVNRYNSAVFWEILN